MENAVLTSWIALSVGFLHALEPGHGKTALLTYLASGKKSWYEGIIISISSALTHSASVFIIAFLSHLALHHDSIEGVVHRYAEVLSIVSASLIIGLGVWGIFNAMRGEEKHDHCCHQQDEHKHDHRHRSLSKSSLITSGIIGVATGIIPCPTVIVAYLSGVSSGNTILGIKSVLFFAIGMILSLLMVITFFNFGGHKIINKFKPSWAPSVNWGYIQGSVFILIGLFTAFYH